LGYTSIGVVSWIWNPADDPGFTCPHQKTRPVYVVFVLLDGYKCAGYLKKEYEEQLAELKVLNKKVRWVRSPALKRAA